MEETKNNIVVDDSQNRITQKKIVMGHLLEAGSLSEPFARNNYHIGRLGAIIYTLRQEGWKIETERIHGINQGTGHPCSCANYIYKGVVAA